MHSPIQPQRKAATAWPGALTSLSHAMMTADASTDKWGKEQESSEASGSGRMIKWVLMALINDWKHNLITVLKRLRQIILFSQTGRQNISGSSPPAYVIITINIQTPFKKTPFLNNGIAPSALLNGWRNKHLMTQPGDLMDMGRQCHFRSIAALSWLSFNVLD